MGLLDDLEKTDKKGLFTSDDNVVNYPTGIMALDAANGYYQEVHTEEGTELVPMYGITGGTFISVIGSTGSGKAQPDDTPIPTPDGIKRLDEIEVGDFVFDPTGNPTRVLGVYPQGIKDNYKITLKNGASTHCCDEHLWTVLKDNTILTVMLKDFMKSYEGYLIPIYTPQNNDAYIPLVEIESIEYVGKASQRCIYVEHPCHLYVTENNIITHNTTFADQLGWNIIKNFEDGVMYHIDAEKTSFKQRIIDICGAKYDDPRIKLIKNHTSIEDVQQMFNKICDVKEAGGDQYKYEVKGKSLNGKPFKHYVPTVFIIDSLPSFNSKDYNVEDLGNNVDQMRAAKDVTRFYTNCLDRAWKYNITFIVINHIRPKADMNPYAAPPRGLLMLGPQETLPRGQVAQYYSQTFIRINNKKSDAYTMEDNGFTGYKCTMQLAKSKSNVVGTSFPVAFISELGFDPVYSIYEFANSIGMIGGRNPYLYIQGLEQFKFNRKDFRSKMIQDIQFREAVLEVLRPYYDALLGSKKNLEEEENQPKIGYGEIGF